MKKRNIIDHYAYWTNDAIRADLERKKNLRTNNFSVLCCNWQNDFNIAGVIRNANAFLASRVYVYGRRKYDKRGTVGTHNYMKFSFVKKLEDIKSLLDKYVPIGIDNVPGAIPINDYKWPKNTLMCFGQESIGLEPEILNLCKDVVYIRQYGSVRSLNASCASSIAMYDWCRKNN